MNDSPWTLDQATEIIRKHRPSADFTLPPLSSEAWCTAIAKEFMRAESPDYVDGRMVAGYPISEADYAELTFSARPAPEVEKTTPSGPTKFTGIHANFIAGAWIGLLIYDGEIVYTSKVPAATEALAKKPIQPYYGMLKAGTKTLEWVLHKLNPPTAEDFGDTTIGEA